MNCPSCSKKVAGSYEVGSYSCSGCGGQIQVNPSRSPRVEEIESHSLSGGGRVRVTKLGREYQFDHLYGDGHTPPDLTMHLTKSQAMKMLADAIRDDVTEFNPARHKHVAFGKEGADKRWGKSKATSSKKNVKKNPQPKKARPVDEVLEEQYPSKGEKLKLHWDEEGGYDGEYGSYVDEEGYAWQQRLFQEGGVHCFICGAPLSEGWESDVMDRPRESCPRHVEIADIGKTTGRPKKGTPGWNDPDRTAWVEDTLSNPGSVWHINQAQSEAVRTRMSEMQGGLAYFPKSDAAQHRDKWESQLRMASGGRGMRTFNDKVYKKAHDASAAAYIDYGKKMDADSYYGGYHPSSLPSQEPTKWIGNPSSNPPSQELFDSIVFGSKVTIENRHGQKQTGTAIIYNKPGMLADGSEGSWALNMGGKYGRPGRATPSNVVSVPKKRGGKRTLGTMRLSGDYRNPVGNPKRMDYAVFVPAGEAASGSMRWAMQSEGFRQESTFASSAWWTRTITKKEALSLGKKFNGLVTQKPASSSAYDSAYDGPTFRMTSTVVKDFRAAPKRGRAEPGSDPMFANPPFKEHKLEAKEKHWALEDNPAGSEIFGVDDMEEWASTIKSGLNAPYSRMRITTDGARAPSRAQGYMIVRLSLDEREDWANGIFENSRWAQIGLGNDGTMEMPYHGLGKGKGMRKTKFKSADDVVRKINTWIQKS